MTTAERVVRYHAGVCAVCGSVGAVSSRTGRCGVCAWHRPHVSRISHTSRYLDDPEAQAFVSEHPGGATLDEIGEAFSLTRERVRQIEAKALARMRARCRLLGITAIEVLGEARCG